MLSEAVLWLSAGSIYKQRRNKFKLWAVDGSIVQGDLVGCDLILKSETLKRR